ncbi:MAG: hypothetical protein VX017_10880, partial [Pseudomonadota bacterium]|nr:hypothetical protein [Pseudomonadota bacterium]
MSTAVLALLVIGQRAIVLSAEKDAAVEAAKQDKKVWERLLRESERQLREVEKQRDRAQAELEHAVKSLNAKYNAMLAERMTAEDALAAEARELLGAAGAAEAHAGGALCFGPDIELPAELAMVHLLPLLTRCTVAADDNAQQTVRAGELEAASSVNKQWHGVCLA